MVAADKKKAKNEKFDDFALWTKKKTIFVNDWQKNQFR